MKSSYLAAARRTAIVPRNGCFAGLCPHELAAPVVSRILADVAISRAEVGELVASNCLGEGGNPARLVALASGLPVSVAGLSIDRQCAGGLDAILLADAMIRSGQHHVVIAGGVESYSRQPLRLRTFPDGQEPVPYEQAHFTPWPAKDPNMAFAADRLAKRFGIGREEQDQWASDSHRKALASSGRLLSDQLVAVRGLTQDPFTRDLGPRLAARAKVVYGSITAANMAVAADAAAFVILVSEEKAQSLGLTGVELVTGVTIGGDPEWPGLAPVVAIQKVLRKVRLSPADLQVVEIMEAFAVQAMVCQRSVNIPPEITNPHGGALARGHPVGASGAILLVNLFHTLRQYGGVGLAAIAAAGGLGTALVARCCS